MSATDRWTHTLETELRLLLGTPSVLAGDDSWRLLVLLSRVAQHPSPPEAVEQLAKQASASGFTARALRDAERPVAAEVLDALDEALLSGEDPAGPIADALLDLDDLLSVLDLEGRETEAGGLTGHAVALLDLAPVAAAALDKWAIRRLSTLDESASSDRLWRAVAAAGAQAVVQAQPAVGGATLATAAVLDLADRRRPRAQVIELFTAVPPVRSAWRPAAAAMPMAWEPVEGESWTVYDQDGAIMAQVRAPTGSDAPSVAHIVVSAGDRRWVGAVRAERRSGRSAWYRLGTERELASLFADVRVKLGVGPERSVRVSLEWEPDGNG